MPENAQVDYEVVGRDFVCRVMGENNRRLSRTHQGHSDTGTSVEKLPLLLTGDALRERVEQNGLRVCAFVHAQSSADALRSEEDVHKLLLAIADITNHGLLPAGPFRTWHIAANQPSATGGPAVSGPEPSVVPERIQDALTELCRTVWQGWNELLRDPVPAVAWAEWQLGGGPLHPFYDGCGRISRAFAAALLVRAGRRLPLFDTSSQYFAAGNRGTESFIAYYNSRIAACRYWVDGPDSL
jgi:hypothetical protein